MEGHLTKMRVSDTPTAPIYISVSSWSLTDTLNSPNSLPDPPPLPLETVHARSPHIVCQAAEGWILSVEAGREGGSRSGREYSAVLI